MSMYGMENFGLLQSGGRKKRKAKKKLLRATPGIKKTTKKNKQKDELEISDLENKNE
jgi:hypothetical protein